MKQQDTEEKHLFTNKMIWTLLIPLMIEQLLNSLMGMADTVMVSNVGSAAMSAVSLVDSINMLIIQAFSALAAGGSIVCSQYIGKKSEQEAKEAARQLILVMAVISLAIAIPCLLGNRGLLRLIFGSVEEHVMKAAVIYFYFTATSFPFIALYNGGAAIYRAQGNSRLPMKISVISNVLNVAGNAIFIWGFHLGVAGAALATLLSRMFCAITVLAFLYRSGQQISVNQYLKIRPEKKMIVKILGIGIPSGIENSMFQFGKLAIQSTVSTLGTTAIAAQAMTNIMENLNGVVPVGIGLGLMTIVGQCMGAGRKEEAIYYIRKILVWAEIAMICSCLFVYAIARPITVIGAMEQESASLCIYMVGWITIFKPIFWVLSFVIPYGLRAAGDVRFCMLISTTTMWLCRVSLCIFLIRIVGLGPIAVWIGMFADWGIRAVIFSLRFHRRKWLRYQVI